MLAAGSGLPTCRWYLADEVVATFPAMRTESLKGAYSYRDGLMNDHALGHWAADRAREIGVRIYVDGNVIKINAASGGGLANERFNFDRIVNAAWPWGDKLLASVDQASSYPLDRIRGSHLVLPGRIAKVCVLLLLREWRIVFALPHGENTLFGTIEMRQQPPETEGGTADESNYLLTAWNQFFVSCIGRNSVLAAYSGVRPIVASRRDHSATSWESVIERQGKLINIFRGKWTTARALADKAAIATLN